METTLPDPSAPPAVAHADRTIVIRTIIAFWAFYFALNTLKMFLYGEENQVEMMFRRAAVVAAGVAFTFLMWGILYRLEERPTRVMLTAAFLLSIPLSFIYDTVNFTAFYVVAPPLDLLEEMSKKPDNMGPLMEIIGYATT